jgi:hypothetical protein
LSPLELTLSKKLAQKHRAAFHAKTKIFGKIAGRKVKNMGEYQYERRNGTI